MSAICMVIHIDIAFPPEIGAKFEDCSHSFY